MDSVAETSDLVRPDPLGAPGPADAAAKREDERAQSTLSMVREPANRAPGSSHPIWRTSAPREGAERRTVSGFDSELRVMSRILGAAFVALVVATIGLIGWQLAATAPVAPAPITDAPAAAVETQEPGAAESAFAAPVTEAPARRAESASDFGGGLRDGVDPALPVGPGQGVLQLDGPAEVTARVDGIDRGALPISLVLDEGRHVVRYEHAGRRSVRFYFVRAGATRVLEVITRPGGFVDAR